MQSAQAGEQRNTVYIAGFSQDVDSQLIYAAFLPFGEILDVQLPPDPAKRGSSQHRGFGFVTYSNSSDALDAVDNMHLNELNGRILKVNIAKPVKGQRQLGSNRAIWEDEQWIKENVKGLSESVSLQAAEEY